MEKKSKKSIIIGVSVLLLVALTLIGLTYAYYRTRVIGNPTNESISVTSKLFEVTYTDGDANFELDSKVEPSNETVYTKTFTVTNTGSETASYSIVIDNMTNTFERNQDWEYTLTTGGETLASGYLAVGTHQILVASRELTKATNAETYTLSLKYINSEEDQSEDMGQTLKFRINISDETYTWENPGTGTLLAAIKANNTVGEPSTIPGQEPSASDEKVLASTEDDYGTSYYFRGNVENNYVTYSGMCWRIVRVQGDGTIKLALAGPEYGGCDVSYAGIGSTTKYNYSDAINDGILAYADSNIPSLLNAWVDKEINYAGGMIYREKNLDTTKLVETDWCNDVSVVDVFEFGETADGSKTNNRGEAASWYTNYITGAAKRLKKYTSDIANPTLKCNMKGVEADSIETKAIRYKNIIGLLTADELAYAGATKSDGNTSYHLYSSIDFWTMSLAGEPMYLSKSGMYISSSSGHISYSLFKPQYNGAAIRPSVVLKSTTLVTTNSDTETNGLPGTQTNPYVVS